MSKLKLRNDYLRDSRHLVVEEVGKGIVAVQVDNYWFNPYKRALSAKEIAEIAAKILEENTNFGLRSLSGTIDGAILCFVQTMPESHVVNCEA